MLLTDIKLHAGMERPRDLRRHGAELLFAAADRGRLQSQHRQTLWDEGHQNAAKRTINYDYALLPRPRGHCEFRLRWSSFPRLLWHLKPATSMHSSETPEEHRCSNTWRRSYSIWHCCHDAYLRAGSLGIELKTRIILKRCWQFVKERSMPG